MILGHPRVAWRAGLIAAALLLAAGAAAQSPTRPSPILPSPAAPLPEPSVQQSVAANVDHAYAAYQTGFYARAFREATARVARSSRDAAAMTLLGELYRQGLGLKVDLPKAAEWYRLAHERGDTNASFVLAMATLNGAGVPRDPAAARRLLETASFSQPLAAYNLALILLASADARERAAAVPLLERASAAEIGDAQHALGVLKKQGRDTPVDLDGAADLMRRAGQNGSQAGEIEYAIMLFNGQGVGRDEAGAALLFQRLAERGNPIAQNRLARLVSAGRGRARDPVGAAAWQILASQQGLNDEMLDRAFDNLTPQDKGRALELAARRAPQSLTAPAPAGQ
jgi:uncharacterized protein